MELSSQLPPRRDVVSAIVKISLLAIVCVVVPAYIMVDPNDRLRSRRQFVSWYGQFGDVFDPIAKEECAQQYDTYLYGTRQNTTTYHSRGAGPLTMFIHPMIECILNGTSEYTKYALGSTQVMLGLTPTIIALLLDQACL
jgi:hypothetical protein